MPLITSIVLSHVLLLGPPKPALQPDFLYNGVDRSLLVTVNGPAGGKREIRIVKPESNVVIYSSPAARGKQDLAKLFPQLWKDKKREVLYAELTIDGKRVGSSLVLQPMTNPPVCTLDATTKNPKWDADEDDTYAGVRIWQNQNVVIDTEFGEAEFKMRPDQAPNTVFNFVQLVQGGIYRDVIFHRIVQKHPRTGKMFVIQAGDPTGTGSGSPGYSFILEKSNLKHDFGVLGMARSSDPNTNGSQFYVALSREATQHLDGRYVTYGELVRGKDVIEKIANVPIGPKDDRPVKPPLIKNARLVDPAN
jgi:peptidyl-prolyl cis-trans isomerase B (cyclophilin B)